MRRRRGKVKSKINGATETRRHGGKGARNQEGNESKKRGSKEAMKQRGKVKPAPGECGATTVGGGERREEECNEKLNRDD